MEYTLRPYQQESSDIAVKFFNDRKAKYNAIIVEPTGSGKSLVIADIAHKLEGNTLILQPNKEILEQNFAKLCSYGVLDCSIYSASLRKKDISRITFATIGSIMAHIDDFDMFKNIIIDECHNVSADGGQYLTFLNKVNRKVLGLTATPYRLFSTQRPLLDKEHKPIEDRYGNKIMDHCCILKLLTRMRPRFFEKIIYSCQIQTLLEEGFLAKLKYFDLTPKDFSQDKVKRNSTGMDFDDHALSEDFKRLNMNNYLVSVIKRLQCPKNGIPRKGILVFTKYVDDSILVSRQIPDSVCLAGDTPKKERKQILDDFRSGKIKVVLNCQVLTTGFDYPELDTIVMARPTMSLALWYQIVGRAIRPFPGKDGWIVDLCGNLQRFGKVDDLMVSWRDKKIIVETNGKQLTNVMF